MEFICFLGLVFLIFYVMSLRSDIRKTQRELTELKRSLGQGTVPNTQLPVSSQAQQTPPVSQPAAFAEPVAPAEAPPYAGAYNYSYLDDVPAAAPQPNRPAASQTPPPYRAPAPRKADGGTMERWIGRNLLGLAAAVLIFVGIVFFAVLVYDQISEVIKVVLMYALSAGLVIGGVVLSRKKKNVFTEILTGSGFGAFFISILLTHVVFGYISFLVAFALLLVWLCATLAVTKALDSVILSWIAHMGMVISVFLAFSFGVTAEQFGFLLLYQVAAVAVLVLGNLFFYPRTFRLSLITGLLLTPTAAGYLSWFFDVNPYTALMIPTGLKMAAFGIQLVCALIFSLLLTCAVRRTDSEDFLERKGLADWLHGGQTVVLALVVSGCIAELLRLTSLPINTMETIFRILALVLPAIYGGGMVFLRRSGRLSLRWEQISVMISTITSSTILYLLWDNSRIPLLVIPAALLLVLATRRKGSARLVYELTGLVILLLDLFCMLTGGYRFLAETAPVLPFLYLLLYPACLIGLWLISDPEIRATRSAPYRIAGYLVVMNSLYAAILYLNLDTPFSYFIPLSAVLHLILLAVRYDRPHGAYPRAVSIFFQLASASLLLNYLVQVFLSGLSFAGIEGSSARLVFGLLMTGLSLGIFVLQLLPSRRLHPAWSYIMSGEITLMILAFLASNTAWFDNAYVLSICTMVLALCFVIGGFVASVKPFRIYGLALILLCVVKLVTFDVSGLNTMFRVIALIGGGLICFAISALYNYSVKQLGERQEAEVQAPQTPSEEE